MGAPMTKFVLYASLFFGTLTVSEAVAQYKPQQRRAGVDRITCEEQRKIAQEVGSRRPRAAPSFFKGVDAGFRACLEGRDFKAAFLRARQRAEVAEAEGRINRPRAEARIGPRRRAIASQNARAAPVPVAPTDDVVAYCAQTFRSYDPASGTFLGYDGLRRPCP
jgi:hypothetical protein